MKYLPNRIFEVLLPSQVHFVMCLVERGFISKVNPSFYNFQTETLVMRTSAKNTDYSEVLIFILKLYSKVKSDCNEILSGALVYGDIYNDQRILSQVDWKLSK